MALSDYSALFQNNNDTMFDAVKFGVAIVTAKDFEALMSASADFDLLNNNIVCYPGFIPEGQLFPQYVSTVCIVGTDGTVVTNQSPYLGSSFLCELSSVCDD